MRPIWKGSLTFGLVHIPVQLQVAVRDAERVHFRQLHAADHAPIRMRRVCEAEDVEVPWAEVVKGYEYEKGKFVVLEPAELKALALPSSKAIEVLEFVAEDDVDPRYFDKPYYLLPQRGAEKPYALLREAIRESGMIGIGTVTLREGSHHLAAVRVVGDALVLELLRFATEVVELDEYTFPSAEHVRPQELAMAAQLIGNLAGPFDPAKYRDEYQEAVRALIDEKLAGRDVSVAPVSAPKGTPVVDLLARLQESVALGRQGLARRGGAREPAHGRAAVKTRSAAARTKATATAASEATGSGARKPAAAKSTARKRRTA